MPSQHPASCTNRAGLAVRARLIATTRRRTGPPPPTPPHHTQKTGKEKINNKNRTTDEMRLMAVFAVYSIYYSLLYAHNEEQQISLSLSHSFKFPPTYTFMYSRVCTPENFI